MAIQLSDIGFFLSGGSTNSNPSASLGGSPSGSVLQGSMNNLFSDIASEDATNGKTDYRCFYVFNKSEVDHLYDAEIYLESQVANGATVSIGVQTSTEVQRISIVGPVYFGGLDMRYGSQDFTVAWGGSAGAFETNLQAGLGGIAPGVSVATEVQGNNYKFTISFLGGSDKRSHPLLEVMNNGLLAPDTPIVSVARVAEGSPINSVAPLLSVSSVPPARVSFQGSTIAVGDLGPGDGLPVWVKRVTPAGTDYIKNDGFTFGIFGRPF